MIRIAVNDIVMVTWRDARCFSGTYKENEIQQLKCAVFETVGHFISRDSNTIIVAGERNDEGQYRDVSLIPTGMVTSVVRLTVTP